MHLNGQAPPKAYPEGSEAHRAAIEVAAANAAATEEEAAAAETSDSAGAVVPGLPNHQSASRGRLAMMKMDMKLEQIRAQRMPSDDGTHGGHGAHGAHSDYGDAGAYDSYGSYGEGWEEGYDDGYGDAYGDEGMEPSEGDALVTADYASAQSYMERALALATDGMPQGVGLDVDLLEPSYYLGLMHYHGMGTEVSCDRAVGLLGTAARHTVWLQPGSEGPSSLFGLLQSAIKAFEDGKIEEALRRYETLAWLGDPQSQLNAAFLLQHLARSSPILVPTNHIPTTGNAHNTAAAHEGAWARRVDAYPDLAAVFWARADELQQNLYGCWIYITNVVARLWGVGKETCVGESAEAEKDVVAAAYLVAAKHYYSLAAKQGASEAQRELGHCHLSGWKGACSTENSTEVSFRASVPIWELRFLTASLWLSCSVSTRRRSGTVSRPTTATYKPSRLWPTSPG